MDNINSEHTKDKTALEVVHSHHLKYHGKEGIYHVLGSLSMDISSMRVSLHIERPLKRKQRIKLDLYDYPQIQKYCTRLSEEDDFHFPDLETDLLQLTDALERYREVIFTEDYQAQKPRTRTLTIEKEEEVIELLKRNNLLEVIQEKLGNIGIAGEADNRLILFLIASSYKHKPLHAVIQSSSGSGKSHLINTIANCFPEEEVMSLSRVTSKSFYHYHKDELKHKLLLIQDFDGLDDEALFALRELQSFGKLTTSMTGKDPFGNHRAKLHTVEAHFSSLGATTKSLYTDNNSRSILLKIDESEVQTKRILNYQAPEQDEILRVQTELQNIIRLLKPQIILNPYAQDISIPHTIPMARRLNTQLKQFIEHITFIHQYQREQDEEGRIMTTQKDISLGIEIFFEALWMKVDELDPSARQFFERLKEHLKNRKSKDDDDTFILRDIRKALHISRSTLHRIIQSLIKLGYIHISSGTANRGYHYRISYWDDSQYIKETLKNSLAFHSHPTCFGTPNPAPSL